MKKHAIYLFGIIVLLAGCASNPAAEQAAATRQMEYKIRVYGPACQKLGFAKDSDVWRECVQREYEQAIIRQQNQWNDPYWGRPSYPYYYWHAPYYRRR